jgi:hypothetical protein
MAGVHVVPLVQSPTHFGIYSLVNLSLLPHEC